MAALSKNKIWSAALKSCADPERARYLLEQLAAASSARASASFKHRRQPHGLTLAAQIGFFNLRILPQRGRVVLQNDFPGFERVTEV